MQRILQRIRHRTATLRIPLRQSGNVGSPGPLNQWLAVFAPLSLAY